MNSAPNENTAPSLLPVLHTHLIAQDKKDEKEKPIHPGTVVRG